jgi:hypothetical protein
MGEAQVLSVLWLFAFACFGFAIWADHMARKEMASVKFGQVRVKIGAP